MSQFYVGASAGSLPPAVPLQFTADTNGTFVAAANNVNLLGGFTEDNNENGIRVYGDSGGDTGTIQLTNRLYGGTSTLDEFEAIAIDYTLPATVAVYIFEFRVAAINLNNNEGAVFSLFAGLRSDGVTATLIGDTDKIKHADSSLSASDANVGVSGNDVQLLVTGIAGTPITWTGLSIYVRSV